MSPPRLVSLEPIEIARREEERQARGTAEIAHEAEPINGGWMAYVEPGSWANQACGLGLHGPIEDTELDRLVEFYVSRGVEPRIEVAAFAEPTLIRGLADRGFVLRELENVLALDLSQPPASPLQAPPDDLRIAAVDRTDDAALRELASLTSSLFVPVGEDVPEHMIEMAMRIAKHPRCTGFMCWQGSVPVGGGTLEIDGDIASLIGAAVVPSHRRRGIQTALMQHRIDQAREAGCRLAVIHSRPGIPTERNAARLGFYLAYCKVVLVKPGEGLVPSP